MTTHPVIIIGAGWAGLAAAVELSKHNIPVTVFESARQPGGRARTVVQNNMMLDNGQHLMIGAYHQMISLLKTVKVNIDDVFIRIPQQLEIIDLEKCSSVFKLKLPRLPAPFNLLVGIFSCPSINLSKKIKILYQFNKLLNTPLNKDISVDTWLLSSNLPDEYTEYLLKPLCLAALTTHSHEASARTFQTVLQQTFNGPASNTDLLIPAIDLGHVFPDAAIKYIESKGGQVLLERRVNKLNYTDGKIKSIIVNDQTIETPHVILATPAQGTEKLLSDIDICQSISQQLKQLDYEPVTTVYLQYNSSVRLPLPMIGTINGISEWIFDRRHCLQPGLISVVISANGPHMELTNQQLSAQVASELANQFPDWPAADSIVVIREKRATLRCIPDADNIRPAMQTPISNLHLCGDYVYIEENNQPGLPSTLEGAMRSGVKCAQQLIQEYL